MTEMIHSLRQALSQFKTVYVATLAAIAALVCVGHLISSRVVGDSSAAVNVIGAAKEQEALSQNLIAMAGELGDEAAGARAAIDLAAAVNAGVTMRTAIEGAQRNGVEASCTAPECSVGVSPA